MPPLHWLELHHVATPLRLGEKERDAQEEEETELVINQEIL